MEEELSKLLGEVKDFTEPSHIEKLDMYLDSLYIEDQEFMELLIKKLEHADITWQQPWYQQSKSLTRRLQQDSESINADKFITGNITKKESEKIEKNWQTFRKNYNIPDKPICLARWRNKDKSRSPTTPEERARHFVMAYLAHGLERPLNEVYKHFTSHYAYPAKGNYSPVEELIMKICFHHKPKTAVTYLSTILGREPRGLYKRLHYMHNEKPPKRSRMKWTLPKATKFLKLLIKYSGLPLEELKYKTFDKSIWLKLGEKFQQDYVYMQKFWYRYLHVQIFVKSDVKMKRLRRKIYKRLRASYQVWTDIRWSEFVNNFPDGFTHNFLHHVAHQPIHKYPGYLKAPIEEVVNCGLQNTKLCRNKRLKTLTLNKDGFLEKTLYKKNKVEK